MSRFFLAVKLIILQCALRGGLLVGSWIAHYKGTKSLPLATLNHIIINRSDRIGDAILSVPLIEIYIEALQRLGYTGSLTILSSQLNDFVLRPLERYKGVKVEISPVILPEYVSGVGSLLKKIKNRVFSLLFFRPTDPLDTTTLLLDFMANGDAAVPLHYKKYGNPIIYGLNALTSTILYDRSLPRALVHRSQSNLIDTYLELLTKSISEMHDLREQVAKEFDTRFYPCLETLYPEVFDESFDVIRHGTKECLEWAAYYESLTTDEREKLALSLKAIHQKCIRQAKKQRTLLIFVGAYSHRSLPIATWYEMILTLSRELPDYDITLMDGPENTILTQILRQYPDICTRINISIETSILPLKLFALYASRCSHVIGLDGGGINFIRRFSHSLSIFTFANPLVWRAYTGSKQEKNINGIKGWYLKYFYQDHKSISHMAKKHPLLPTFNISEAKVFIKDLDTQLIIEWIHSTSH